jgi:hypothetical protein
MAAAMSVQITSGSVPRGAYDFRQDGKVLYQQRFFSFVALDLYGAELMEVDRVKRWGNTTLVMRVRMTDGREFVAEGPQREWHPTMGHAAMHWRATPKPMPETGGLQRYNAVALVLLVSTCALGWLFVRSRPAPTPRALPATSSDVAH